MPPLIDPTSRPSCFLYYVKQLRIRSHLAAYKCLSEHMVCIGFKLAPGIPWSKKPVYLTHPPGAKKYDAMLRVGEGHGRVTEAAGFHSDRILTWLITTVVVGITFPRIP